MDEILFMGKANTGCSSNGCAFGIIRDEVLRELHGIHRFPSGKIWESDTTREIRYYEWVAQNCKFDDEGTSQGTTMHDNPCRKVHQKPYTLRLWKHLCLNSKGDYRPISSGRFNLNIKPYFCNSSQSQSQPNEPRPQDYSFKEWLKIKIWHTHVNKSVRNAVLNEWLLDSFDLEADYARTRDDPYSRRFDKYKNAFDNEIRQLSNEYDLRIGKKGLLSARGWNSRKLQALERRDTGIGREM
ncbi:hypothetical protein Tco_0392365 [Tanacetum coccineum]